MSALCLSEKTRRGGELSRNSQVVLGLGEVTKIEPLRQCLLNCRNAKGGRASQGKEIIGKSMYVYCYRTYEKGVSGGGEREKGGQQPTLDFGLWSFRFPPVLVRTGRRLPVQALGERRVWVALTGCPRGGAPGP